MLKITDHIPPDILKNPSAAAFGKVLDGMQEYRNEQLLNYEQSFNFYTAKQNVSVNDNLYEAGQIVPLTDSPMFLKERLIENSYELWRQKGNPNGLEFMVWAYCDGVLQSFDASQLRVQEMLIPGHLDFGYLPNGGDLELSVTEPKKYPFLFSGSFSMYYGYVELEVRSDYFNESQQRQEMILKLIEHIPMSSPGSTGVTVNFYTKTTATFIEALNI